MDNSKKKQRLIANLLFVLLCIVIIVLLLLAPKESTPKLPNDTEHAAVRAIKSEMKAEKRCVTCHSPKGVLPLSAKHPPKYRCLLCHRIK